MSDDVISCQEDESLGYIKYVFGGERSDKYESVRIHSEFIAYATLGAYKSCGFVHPEDVGSIAQWVQERSFLHLYPTVEDLEVLLGENQKQKLKLITAVLPSCKKPSPWVLQLLLKLLWEECAERFPPLRPILSVSPGEMLPEPLLLHAVEFLLVKQLKAEMQKEGVQMPHLARWREPEAQSMFSLLTAVATLI